jgi:hypothetical protein
MAARNVVKEANRLSGFVDDTGVAPGV